MEEGEGCHQDFSLHTFLVTPCCLLDLSSLTRIQT